MSRRIPCAEPEGLRYCTRCTDMKAPTEFYASRAGVVASECKACLRARAALHRVANREKNAVYARQYRAQRPGLWRSRRAADPEKWLAHARAANSKRRARERGAVGNGLSAAEWLAMKREYGGRCAYCGDVAKLTMDHVDPLDRGGTHTSDNIVPACGRCNSSKHNLTLLLWLRRSAVAKAA